MAVELTGADPSPDVIQSRLAQSIRTSYLEVAPSGIAFAYLAIAVTVAVFWNDVAVNQELLFWAGAQMTLLFGGFVAVRHASADRFMVIAVVVEALQSSGWGAISLIALPVVSDWQVFQGLILTGLLLATLSNATSTSAIHVAATVPIAVISIVVFAWHGEGAAQWIGAAMAVALPFALSAGSILRQVQVDLVVTSLRNEQLAASLRNEGIRIKAVNDRLAGANSHLDQQSRIDALTGLCNRTGFTSILNRAVVGRPGKLVVCYLDIDRFKRINDAFGHRFGDLVLQAAAHRLSNALRPNEVLARQGGDELTLLGFANDRDELEDLGRRILSVFEEPFHIEERRIEVRVSVGMVWLPAATNADDLMRFADTALYKAKENGRARFEIFDDTMRVELMSRTQLQTDLGGAFERLEIVPYLQPIVDIATGEICSAEALARWEHPDGVRSAAEFIETARDLGMLDQINDVIATGVFEFQRQMHANGRQACPITLNSSPIHFEAMLDRVIAEDGMDPVIIEITEDGIFSDLDGARRLLQRARNADINVLLDDFGVGFSSLSIATELPIDGFKIDRGFVASLSGNPSAVAAVEAILQLAARMDLQVIAEGVETVEQLNLLRQLGVRYAQGYLFSEAVPTDTFANWLHSDHTFDVHRQQAEV